MDTKIFCFSATGNSLLLARALAEGLGGAELVLIPKALRERAEVRTERVGFVFPVVAWGVPRIVAELLRGLKLQGSPYVFAAVTCGGTPANTLKELRRLLRRAGADLHAGFVCREGSNAVTDDPGFIRLAKRLNHVRYPPAAQRMPELLEAVRAKKAHRPETSSPLANCYGSMMHGLMALAGDKLKAADSAYRADDRCNGCRVCERVCPRGNVRVEGGRPAWHHDCEMCNACIQWCPLQAIHVAGETCRYHNPAMKAEDLFIR